MSYREENSVIFKLQAALESMIQETCKNAVCLWQGPYSPNAYMELRIWIWYFNKAWPRQSLRSSLPLSSWALQSLHFPKLLK